jgi:hypothetical protein
MTNTLQRKAVTTTPFVAHNYTRSRPKNFVFANKNPLPACRNAAALPFVAVFNPYT